MLVDGLDILWLFPEEYGQVYVYEPKYFGCKVLWWGLEEVY